MLSRDRHVTRTRPGIGLNYPSQNTFKMTHTADIGHHMLYQLIGKNFPTPATGSGLVTSDWVVQNGPTQRREVEDYLPYKMIY